MNNMKKQITKIVLKNDRANDIPMFTNYTHFKFLNGGIVLLSNKGLNLPKVFIPLVDVAYIIWR